MPWFDMPLEQLRDYRTDTTEPPDLDLWWQRQLEQARAAARLPALTRYEADTYAPVAVYDTEFSGAAGDRIRAWYLRPADTEGHTPMVVPQAVAVCHADVPFLCDIQRGITLAPEAPYTEVPELLAHNVDLIQAAPDTLRYVDCAPAGPPDHRAMPAQRGPDGHDLPAVHVVRRVHEVTAGKDLLVHPFTGHVVPSAHVERQLRHLRDFLR
jgi:cephalosporin-C deacetylase-like acetyl esterase